MRSQVVARCAFFAIAAAQCRALAQQSFDDTHPLPAEIRALKTLDEAQLRLAPDVVGPEDTSFALFSQLPGTLSLTSLGEGFVESCIESQDTAPLCDVRFKPFRALLKTNPKDEILVRRYELLTRSRIVKLFEEGKQPKKPGESVLAGRSYQITVNYRPQSMSLEEGSSNDFNFFKYSRRRSWLQSFGIEATWWVFGIGYQKTIGPLPTQNFFGDAIKSELSEQRLSYFLSQQFFSKRIGLRAGIDQDSLVFTTENDNETIIPSKDKDLWASAGLEYAWNVYLVGDAFKDFTIRLGRTRGSYGYLLKGSTTDTGDYKRGTESAVKGIRWSFGHVIEVDGPRFLAKGWRLGLEYHNQLRNIDFSGATTPSSFAEASTSKTSLNRYLILVEKSHAF
jgi:hypothetical protein